MTLVIEKIRARVVIDSNGCWVWQGAKNHKGYGLIRDPERGRNVSTHRATHEHFKGPIPDGFQVDHLCRNPSCCNPDHLEAVTPAENTRRGDSPRLARLRGGRVTQCPRGHEMVGENVYVDARGAKSCRECRRVQHAKWSEKRKGNRMFTATGVQLSVVRGGRNG